MGRTPANLPSKQSRPIGRSSKVLSENEQKVYNLIQSKESMGISMAELRNTLGLSVSVANKSVEMLELKKLIKPVTHHLARNRKYFMAVEFEPSKEITGGSWYTDGTFDKEFISTMKEYCTRLIEKLRVATIDALSDSVRRSGLLNSDSDCDTSQIADIVQALLIDGKIEELKSTGMGEFSSIPLGRTCYRVLKVTGIEGALASIPCGACPSIYECTPDGIISPSNCVYYQKWLDF